MGFSAATAARDPRFGLRFGTKFMPTSTLSPEIVPIRRKSYAPTRVRSYPEVMRRAHDNRQVSFQFFA